MALAPDGFMSESGKGEGGRGGGEDDQTSYSDQRHVRSGACNRHTTKNKEEKKEKGEKKWGGRGWKQKKEKRKRSKKVHISFTRRLFGNINDRPCPTMHQSLPVPACSSPPGGLRTSCLPRPLVRQWPTCPAVSAVFCAFEASACELLYLLASYAHELPRPLCRRSVC